VADDTGSVVADAVEQQNPIARRRRRPDFPSAQHDAVFCSNREVFFHRAGALQHFFNRLQARERNREAPRMQNSRADYFSGVIGKDWRNREKRDCGDEKNPYHPFE
jgi:hypothetical protein